MVLVDEQIKNLNKAICKNIEGYDSQKGRKFLCQNILNKLRDLTEAVLVKFSKESEYNWENIKNALKGDLSSRADLKFLFTFHDWLQQSVSHYFQSEDNSERLMLKYYEYLLEIKSVLKKNYNIDVLENIDKFPIKVDPSLQVYYEKIVLKINNPDIKKKEEFYHDRYYIKKIKPFFVNQEKYYEITFTTANDYIGKFDSIIAFTKLEILSNYSVKFSVIHEEVEVFNRKMPILIIDYWEVSIRPCELNHFADIFGEHEKINSNLNEYKSLMLFLKEFRFNLVEFVELSDTKYEFFKNEITKNEKTIKIFNILDKARDLVIKKNKGSNIIRYLLYKLNNHIIKLQLSSEPCLHLSNLNLKWGCIPFEEIPFNTSLKGHNPPIYDLLDCFDLKNHENELFARFIKNNTEQDGMLYTPINDLKGFGNISQFIKSYNEKLYCKHRPERELENYKEHIYINSYEQNTLNIIKELKELSKSGLKNYSNSVEAWLKLGYGIVDCDQKKEILKSMFENSHVALIYGAAGTGKTRLIEHISTFFNEYNKLFLADTNPAVNNLKKRVSAGNSSFKTVSSFIEFNSQNNKFEILIIDECSTISNLKMLKVLRKSSFKLLVLVGDIFQIESISFGNWFGIAKSFIPDTSIFELTKPFRTKNKNLLKLWDKIRNVSDDILEHITINNYSTTLDESIFQSSEDDEIILCLNYNGLYGINNINNFLQENNNNKKVQWGIHTYKVGDPILFNELNRFKPSIHNNLKGKIIDFEVFKDKIKFDIEIDKSINEMEANISGINLLNEINIGKSIISFDVYKSKGTDNDDILNTVVPFQVSYAISIHKAQGLEYNSVKVVITEESDEMITHNIFYTAITRSKEKLKIYWTPKTEKNVLTNLQQKINKKDMYLLKAKFNI